MKKQRDFMDSLHLYGRIMSLIAILTFMAVGFSICIFYDVFPPLEQAAMCCFTVASILVVSGSIEFLTFIPKLGSGACYVSFITGNISNMKAPSMEAAFRNLGIEDGTEDKEIVGIIVSCVASLFVIASITLVILFTGVLEPVLSWEPIQPAFTYIMPAMYGILLVGVVFQAPQYAIPIFAFSLAAAYMGVNQAQMIYVSIGFGLALFFVTQAVAKFKKNNETKEE